MNQIPRHIKDVPGAESFATRRDVWRSALGRDEALHLNAVQLERAAQKHHFGYQWEWLGIPIIRHPDDIVLFQEIVWAVKPECIVETGVARGGSVVLSAALMEMVGSSPRVLGLDILIHDHAREAIDQSRFRSDITLWEGDSSSREAASTVEEFLRKGDHDRPVVIVLDSDHTESHVLAELRMFADVIPEGSVVVVADTLIEELPDDHYSDRDWGPGNNPLTAVRRFLSERSDFCLDEHWSRRGLVTEFWDGVLRKIS